MVIFIFCMEYVLSYSPFDSEKKKKFKKKKKIDLFLYHSKKK